MSELLDAATQYHLAGDGVARAAVRSALVVRHALQPFSPAAFGAPLVDEEASEPRRFSFDARWRAAAEEPAGVATLPAFAPTLLSRAVDPGAALSIDRLRSALMRPHAAYLQGSLGLRLPEEEPPLLEHEPFGAAEPLARHALRSAVFERWLAARARPDPRVLHARLLARALVAPGPDGLATVEQVLEEVDPFVQCALREGLGVDAPSLPLAQVAGERLLQGTLGGIQRPASQDAGVLRVALRPEGRHGGQALRHGLDWLLASLHGLPLLELAAANKDEAPVLRRRAPLSREDAIASLQALVELREQALQSPLPFLPRSGFVHFQQLDAGQAKARQKGEAADIEALRRMALERACAEWCGDAQRKRADAGPATRLALRGRDPFIDGDAPNRARFARIAEALFGAFEHGRVLRAEALR